MSEKETDLSAKAIGAEETIEHTAIAPVNESVIRNLIYTVRGIQVMLDSDLALLYQVETKRINETVRRNKARFPEEFCFRLTSDEYESLRSQIATSSNDLRKFASGGRRYVPYVYTEQGVAMLSAVLRSDIAVDVSIRIMKSFVEMRHFIASNAALFEQIRTVELRQLEYQKTSDERFERVFDYMETHETPKQKVFFDGQIYDAFELLVDLVQKAEREIVLVDGYVDAGTLNVLAKKAPDVAVTVWTHPRTSLTQRDVDTFNAQYPRLEVRHTTAFHDRFLVLDGAKAYLVGASIKDAGKKSFGIARLEGNEAASTILARLER